MQSIYYTGDYLKIYSKRYVTLRLVCFSTLFIYGVLDLLEKNITKLANISELLVLFVSIKTLVAFKKHIHNIYRELETARLVVRFFDFPQNIANFFKFFSDGTNLDTEKGKVNKIKDSYFHEYL
jgi:hypothetical protein